MHKSFFLLLSLAIGRLAFAADPDVEKSKDYPLIQRWPHSHISEYKDVDFDAFEFETPEKATRVEGRTIKISYSYDDDADRPSDLKFIRNYQSALKKGGWSILSGEDDTSKVVAKLEKNGREIWAQLDSGSYYTFTIVEKGAMKQEVSANDMLDALNAQGHVALKINFDSGKAIIKPESRPVIEQMIQLMKDAPDLKVEIQGHTDNTGDANADQVLSQQRAAAVVKALTTGGVEASRLVAKGYGLSKPVADNATEEGRAKNRRVELVKLSS